MKKPSELNQPGEYLKATGKYSTRSVVFVYNKRQHQPFDVSQLAFFAIEDDKEPVPIILGWQPGAVEAMDKIFDTLFNDPFFEITYGTDSPY